MGFTDMALRVRTSNGDNPPDDLGALTTSDWKDSLLQNHDCVIRNSKVYANSATMAPSYITWLVRRACVSQMKIAIDGSYSGLWIKLVGLDDVFTKALNGWLNMMELYSGAGTQVIGSNSTGCAVGTAATGHSGTFIGTFGIQSSSFATNNNILIRFRLEGSNVLRSLAITGMVENPDVIW